MKNLLFLILLTTPLLFLNLNGFTQNIPSYIPTNGLVGWYPFNGNTNDESGNGNHGVNNGPLLDFNRSGSPNSSYSFYGTGDFIIIDTPIVYTVSNQMGVCLWSKFDSVPGQVIFRKNFTNNNQDLNQLYVTGLGPSGLGLRIYNESSHWTSYNVSNTNTWNHYCWNLNDSLSELFVNGVSQGVQNLNYPFNSTSGGVFLGSTGSQGDFHGNIDDVGIWDRVLTSSEVSMIYNGNCTQYDTITVLDTIPYSVTDTIFIDVQLTSINPLQFQNTIKVYPNPSRDFLQIDCGDISTLNGYSIKIVNSLGQTVFNNPVSQSPFSINMNGWNGNGLYFLHLIDGSGNITDIRKIVLQ